MGEKTRKKMKRRDFIKNMAATGALTMAAPSLAGKKPNVLFLFTDDHTNTTINALGNDEIITPNIDELVNRGTTFTNTYVMGGWTVAICAPSRFMLLTGAPVVREYKGKQVKAGSRIPDDHITMPEAFKNAGYETFQTGKWHNNRSAHVRSFTYADKIFFGGMSRHYQVPMYDFDPSGKYPPENQYVSTEKHSAEVYGDAAVKYLENYDEDKPFFMYVAFQTPHDPRVMPRHYRYMYDSGDVTLWPNFRPSHPFDPGDANHRDEMLEHWPRTPEAIRNHIIDYYAMITHTDAQIGRIIDALKKSGKYDDTIIVFAGDNGMAVGQQGLMGKQHTYDCGNHVPFVMAGPGVPNDEKRDALLYLFDIFPTLCDMTGVQVPETVAGRSLVKVIRKPIEKIRDDLFFVYKHFQRSIRDERYKLMYFNVKGEFRTRLFDLRNDPWETTDLSQIPQHQDILKRLHELMKARISEYSDDVDLDRPDWCDNPLPQYDPESWRANDPNPDVYYDERWKP
ncbi:sulfatase-like hydrolase/transferase [Candidatus Latescibacterota bacterium]